MLVQATLRRKTDRETKDCTTRGGRDDDEVEVGGKKREGRRSAKAGGGYTRPGGGEVSLVAVAVCESTCVCVPGMMVWSGRSPRE